MKRTRLLHTTRFDVERLESTTPDGRRYERAVVRHPGAVAIVAMVDADHVCLIRNFRVAVEQTLIEIPAGTLEPGEPPLETAQRELQEETGFRAQRWTHLISFFLSPGILDERMHVYLAEEMHAGTPAREPSEQIENLVVAWSEAMEMVRRGEIQDAKTLVGLMYHDRQRCE